MKENTNITYDIDKQFIVLTNSCDLRCSFCYVFNGTDIPKEASLENINDVVSNNSIKNVVLIGGEPTFNLSKLYKALYIIKKNKSIKDVLITSNGNRINKCFNDIMIIDKRTTIQITPYTIETLINIKHDIIMSDNITIHLTISADNLEFIEHAVQYLNKINKAFWITIDRQIQTDISNFIYKLLFDGLISSRNLRDNTTVGKNCTQIYGKQRVLHANGNANTCYNMLCNNEYIKHISKKCMECKNKYCDACICNNVIKNRDMLCKAFNVFEGFEEWEDLMKEARENEK